MKKNLLIALVVLAIILSGYFIYGRNRTAVNLPENNQETAATGTKPITLAEVAAHATSTDCWLAIEGKIYDATPFIASGNHPGGAAILQGCGRDATVLFNTRPMGSGTPHSDTARGYLPNFYIGYLSE